MGDPGAGPSGSNKWARQKATSIDSLPPDVLTRILELGWLPPTPLYDRGDVLRDAAALACVGNATCTELAHRLFAELSPRLGQELPGGVTAASPAKALKEACKAWGLPVGGTKGDLWERLVNEVQDSEVGEDGQAPRDCLVSGATREELAGWSQKRISFKRAKDTFNLWKGEIEACDHILDPNGPGAKPGVPVKAYLLSDVKAKARSKYGNWEGLTGTRNKEKQRMEEWREEYRAKEEQRMDALRDELLRRGHTVAQANTILTQSPAASYATWGSGSGEAPDRAADYLERMHFCVSVPKREKLFALRFMFSEFQAPRSMSQYKAKEHTMKLAADQALYDIASEYRSLEALRADAAVPPSLLPELERLWQSSRTPGAPAPPLIPLEALIAMGEWEYDDVGY